MDNKSTAYFKSSQFSICENGEFIPENSFPYHKIKTNICSQSPLHNVGDIDEIRQENAAYQYLCHLEGARLWMQECIQENLPQSTELEARLRNGVYFAKLGNFIAPHVVPLKKIFDADQKVYNRNGLHYRHTDNINYWILAMKAVGLPSYFYPNSFDVYGKKNMPKAVYCLHALSLYLHRCGKGMKIIDLIGKMQFSSEEINSVSREFIKFGIQLPAFSKIGGILANKILPNDATLHAAIIAINIAICHQNCEHLFASLMNPNAQLQNICKANAESYQKSLLKLKSTRASNIKLKSTNNKNDLYWDFLTHGVIQEEINSVNLMIVLDDLKSASLLYQTNNFINILQHPLLNIADIVIENVNAYISGFKETLIDSKNNIIDIMQVQSLVTAVNYNEFKSHEMNSALINFNDILTSNDYFASFNILKSLAIGINLHALGRQFYHLQFKNLKRLKGGFLDLQDIQTNLPLLTALLDVSMAIIQCSEDDTFNALSSPVIKCWELNIHLKADYYETLKKLKPEDGLDFLSIEQIKKSVVEINATSKLKENSTTSTKHINSAISFNDVNLLLEALLEDPSLLCVDPKHIDFYLSLLSEYKLKKSNCDALSRDEIQQQISIANKLVLEAEYFCACLAGVNMAIDKKDSSILFDSLKTFSKDEILCSRCNDKYMNKLITLKSKKFEHCLQGKDISCFSWIKWNVCPQATFYLNLKTLETAWNQEHLHSLFLNKTEILEVIAEVQSECKCFKYEIFETFMISLQAHIRGFLLRQHISGRRKSSCYTSLHLEAALKVQSFIRMSLVRKKYLKQKSEKLRLHTAARIIQRQWRAFKVNQSLNILAHSSNPPLSLMHKIIYMLEISNDDYSEEFKLHTIKGKAVQTIRYNQTLLKEIDEMDIKIGLLIRNRITLEDLLNQKKKTNLKIKKSEISVTDIKNRGFKMFSKKYNTLIELFENLLYLLQTRPVYLSHLIISLPSNQATSLIESVIFSLYNFGSTPREEYLLLKMLSLTLEEDIKQKGDNLSDIIKGENLIMKIIISFYRKNYWRDCLKTLLQPLVKEVLNDKSALCILDPIEIYKIWQNELEMQTGKKSTMPYEVTVDDALCHLEVNNHLNIYIDNLLKYSLKFCEAVINGQTLIPYGMMYICKILKLSLQKKYPTSSTEELNKIIGNFLYYRYINPAIIAPDVFDIITTQYNEQLADYERLKLSAIAKFLHFSVTGKKYSEDTSHLMCLNPYLSDCHEKFMLFFEDICKVKELEEQFNIDVFSEAIVQIPEVYMSLNELHTIYELLSEKEYNLAQDSDDVLHEILEEFSLNSFDKLVDASDDFLNTEICLSLKSKFDIEVDDEAEDEKMYVETKFILITLLQVFSNVNNVNDLFERDSTFEEEMQFEKICFVKQRDTDFSRNWIKKSRNWKTLPDLQSALQFNLHSLELCCYVTSTNNYQEILNDIAKYIVNRWRYRVSRKKEIFKLLEIQKQLDSKTIFYLEKLDYYNEYIAACLENMKIGKQNTKFFFSRNTTTNELRYKKTIKCSGTKLHEKGILIEIKDLDMCQFKNVNFEIGPAEDLGIFTIKAKFMGIPLETVDIDIQELLDMQYQGIAEMNMFECVKINNNLLLHFINKKFYGKYLS